MILTQDTIIVAGLSGVALTTIGSLAASVTGIMTARTVKTIHILMNSRMDELIRETRAAAMAAGKAAGRAELATETAADMLTEADIKRAAREP